jgi:hypothetical protein
MNKQPTMYDSFFDEYIEMEIFHILSTQTTCEHMTNWYRYVKDGYVLSTAEFEFVNRLYKELKQPLEILYFDMHFRHQGYSSYNLVMNKPYFYILFITNKDQTIHNKIHYFDKHNARFRRTQTTDESVQNASKGKTAFLF